MQWFTCCHAGGGREILSLELDKSVDGEVEESRAVWLQMGRRVAPATVGRRLERSERSMARVWLQQLRRREFSSICETGCERREAVCFAHFHFSLRDWC